MCSSRFTAVAVLALIVGSVFGGETVSVFPIPANPEDLTVTGEGSSDPAGYEGPPTPPPGWELSALNGLRNEGWWHWGPAFIADGGQLDEGPVPDIGRHVLRMSCESPYTSRVYPVPEQTGYRPIKTNVATNLQHVYDLTSFQGDEIAMGLVLRIQHYNLPSKVQGDALMSLSLPGGPGIAIVAGHPGTSYNEDIDNLPYPLYPPPYERHGFHLVQFRQAPPYDPYGTPPSPPEEHLAINVDSMWGTNPKINLQGATRRLAEMMITSDYPGEIYMLGGSDKWVTSYHTFWLYVNKSSKRILAKMDDLPTVDMTLTPLTRWMNHEREPAQDWTPDPAIFSTTLATDWDTTAFAQFGARDYHTHAEYPAWVGPSDVGFWYHWPNDSDQSGVNNPEPYDSPDSVVYFGGGPGDGVLNGNAVLLTTDLSVTPFAADFVCSGHAPPFADWDEDGDVDQVDFGFFQTCFTGRSNPLPSDPALLYCKCLDKAETGGGPTPDGHITSEDLTAFEACATGPDVPWVPTAECP